MAIDYDEVLSYIGELGIMLLNLKKMEKYFHRILIQTFEAVTFQSLKSICCEGTWQKRLFLLLSIPSATSAMAVFMYDFIGKLCIKHANKMLKIKVAWVFPLENQISNATEISLNKSFLNISSRNFILHFSLCTWAQMLHWVLWFSFLRLWTRLSQLHHSLGLRFWLIQVAYQQDPSSKQSLNVPSSKCEMFSQSLVTSLNSTCNPKHFTGDSISCDSWMFNDNLIKSTAVEDFEMVCNNKTRKSLTQTMYMVGMLIGSNEIKMFKGDSPFSR